MTTDTAQPKLNDIFRTSDGLRWFITVNLDSVPVEFLPKAKQGNVYIIQHDGKIKIGYSKRARVRINSILGDCNYFTTAKGFLFAISEPVTDFIERESYLHGFFDHYWIKRELFHISLRQFFHEVNLWKHASSLMTKEKLEKKLKNNQRDIQTTALNRAESGRLGGIETAVRYGLDLCPLCGHIAEKSLFHIENGRKYGSMGGRKVVKLYGPAHMSRIGKLGGRGNTREKRLEMENQDPDMAEVLLA